MFCRNCGCEILKNDKFCANCGTCTEEFKVQEQKEVKQENKEVSYLNEDLVQAKIQYSKTWDTLANVGFWLGLVSLITSFFTCGSFVALNITSLIFSILGKKSFLKYRRANAGLVLSIIGMVLSIIIITSFIIGFIQG